MNGLIIGVAVAVIVFFYCIYRAIKAANPSKNKYEDMEYKMKCNTCGHIWCFNNSDLGKSAVVNASNGLSNLSAAASGNLFNMAASSVITKANKGPETSFNKCPRCGSNNVGIYYEGYANTEDTPSVKSKRVKEDDDDMCDAIIDEQLRTYKKLLNDKIITQEEFDAKKKQLLDL